MDRLDFWGAVIGILILAFFMDRIRVKVEKLEKHSAEQLEIVRDRAYMNSKNYTELAQRILDIERPENRKQDYGLVTPWSDDGGPAKLDDWAKDDGVAYRRVGAMLEIRGRMTDMLNFLTSYVSIHELTIVDSDKADFYIQDTRMAVFIKEWELDKG